MSEFQSEINIYQFYCMLTMIIVLLAQSEDEFFFNTLHKIDVKCGSYESG